MILRNGLRFNCCESTLIIINERLTLPGFNDSTMRVASNLGGGVAGWGDVCGALIGGVMSIGLLYGTEGDESPTEFHEKRHRERSITLELIKEFKSHWGEVKCRDLLGCPNCTPEERSKRGELLRERGESHCDEYVDWTAAKTLKIIKKNP